MIQTDQAVGRGSGRGAWTLRERGAVGLAGLVRMHQAARAVWSAGGLGASRWPGARPAPTRPSPAPRPARSVRAQRMRVPRVRQQARTADPRRGPGLPGLCARPCPRRVLGPVRRAVCACWWGGWAHPALRRVLGPGAVFSAPAPHPAPGAAGELDRAGRLACHGTQRRRGRTDQSVWAWRSAGLRSGGGWGGGVAGWLCRRRHPVGAAAHRFHPSLVVTCSGRSTPLDGARRRRPCGSAPRGSPLSTVWDPLAIPVVDAARNYRDGQGGCGPLPQAARCRWSCAGAAVCTTPRPPRAAPPSPDRAPERDPVARCGGDTGAARLGGRATRQKLVGRPPGLVDALETLATLDMAGPGGGAGAGERAVRQPRHPVCGVMAAAVAAVAAASDRGGPNHPGAGDSLAACAHASFAAGKEAAPGPRWPALAGAAGRARAGLCRGVVPDCARQPHPRHIPPCP